MVESKWDVPRLAAKLGWREAKVEEWLRYGRFCAYLQNVYTQNPEAYRALACNRDGPAEADYSVIDRTQARSEQRLAARKDRVCAYCGKTFTPRNSLGKTSARHVAAWPCTAACNGDGPADDNEPSPHGPACLTGSAGP
jgi:hypothetical protein